MLSLSRADWLAIEREACARSLATFIKRAWAVLEPGQPYVHGWHVDAMAEHLQAVTADQITRLLINIPPGTMKSLMTGVLSLVVLALVTAGALGALVSSE